MIFITNVFSPVKPPVKPADTDRANKKQVTRKAADALRSSPTRAQDRLIAQVKMRLDFPAKNCFQDKLDILDQNCNRLNAEDIFNHLIHSCSSGSERETTFEEIQDMSKEEKMSMYKQFFYGPDDKSFEDELNCVAMFKEDQEWSADEEKKENRDYLAARQAIISRYSNGNSLTQL